MKQESALVSVVIPTYSRPEFLKRAVDSVLNQTYKNIEIFVVDDNDPAGEYRAETEAVMGEYALNSRVTYLKHEKNKGGSAARNTGWKKASGDFITFIDDDDEIMPTKIEEQVSCLEALDASWGMCYTAYVLKKENGMQQTSVENRSGSRYIEGLMRTLYMGSGSNLFLRKSVVDEINGYDESFRRNQDIEFLARALEHYKIAYIDKPLLVIYQEGYRTVLSFEDNEKVAKHYLEKFDARINALPDKDKKRVITVISLERFRFALYAGKYGTGIRILRENHVSLKHTCKYIRYLIHRVLTKSSYGFYI